jgi:hypothetical protein
MSPRTAFRVYVALSIVWALLLIQAISFAAADHGRITIASVALWLVGQTALAALCIRARRHRQPAPR